MHVRHERLSKRGWSKEEIGHLGRTLAHAEKKKHHHLHLLEQVLPATSFLAAIAGNVAFIVLLMPVVLMLPAKYSYFIAFVLGLLFGLMYSFLISEFEHIPARHQVLPLAVVVLFSALLISYMVRSSGALALFPGAEPVIVALIYSLSFVAAPTYRIFLHGD